MVNEMIRREGAAFQPLTFDTETILAFFLKEPGSEVVRRFLSEIQDGTREGFMNIINGH